MKAERKGEVAYRQLVVARDGAETLRVQLTAPINDVMGLWARPGKPQPAESYTVWMHERYSGTFDFSHADVGAGHPEYHEAVKAFSEAARLAPSGRLAAAMGPFIQRLRFAPDGTVDDIPDLPSLAAWSLLESIRRQPLKLIHCPTCKRPWLGTPDGTKYCQRRAPGQMRDCRTLAAERRTASDTEYRAYRREYKRLSEAFRRGAGALDATDWVEWRQANSATSWVPFDQWKARQARRKGDTSA